MSNSAPASTLQVGDENGFKPETTTIALVAENDFEHARAFLPEFGGYSDYQNYLDEREGLHFGLAMAGVEAVMLPLTVDSLLRWRERVRVFVAEREIWAPGSTRSLDADARDLWIGLGHRSAGEINKREPEMSVG